MSTQAATTELGSGQPVPVPGQGPARQFTEVFDAVLAGEGIEMMKIL